MNSKTKGNNWLRQYAQFKNLLSELSIRRNAFPLVKFKPGESDPTKTASTVS